MSILPPPPTYSASLAAFAAKRSSSGRWGCRKTSRSPVNASPALPRGEVAQPQDPPLEDAEPVGRPPMNPSWAAAVAELRSITTRTSGRCSGAAWPGGRPTATAAAAQPKKPAASSTSQPPATAAEPMPATPRREPERAQPEPGPRVQRPRWLSHSIIPIISSALPGSNAQKFEKMVESVKASTRPRP